MKYEYFAFTRAVRDSRELTRDQKHVLYVLALRAINATGIARPSISRIAEDADMSVSSVTRAMKGIRTMGCVTIVFNGRGSKSRKSSEYKLNHPSLWSTTMVTQTTDYGQADHTTTQELHTLGEELTMVTQTILGEPDSSSKAVEVADVLDGPDSSKAVEVLAEHQGPELSSEAGQNARTSTGRTDRLKDSANPCPNGCGTRIPDDWTEQQIYGHFAACRLSSPELRHSARDMLQRAATQKPQGMSQRNARVVENAAKWECTECGGQFSYLGKPGQMCHKCRESIEG